MQAREGARCDEGSDGRVGRPRRRGLTGESLFFHLLSLLSLTLFVDGNKRVGAHCALLYLRANDLEILFSPADLTELTLATARGEMSAEAIAIWSRQRTKRRDS